MRPFREMLGIVPFRLLLTSKLRGEMPHPAKTNAQKRQCGELSMPHAPHTYRNTSAVSCPMLEGMLPDSPL